MPLLELVRDVLAPVFVLIVLGALLRGRLGLGTGAELGHLLYWIALPAQLIHLMAKTDLAHGFPGAAVLVVVVTFAVGIALALAVTGQLPPAVRGSLVNGAVRPNGAFVGLSVITLAALQLGDPVGARLAGAYAALLGPAVIAFNVGAVVAFRQPHHAGTGGGLFRSLADLPGNPILLGCVIGTGLGFWHPGILEGTVPGKVLGMIAGCAVPLALLAAGLGLDFGALRGQGLRLASAAAIKLVVQPAATYLVCRLVGLDPMATATATILMSCPAAMAAVPMARTLGGDVALMSALVTLTTALAPLTMMGWLWLVLGRLLGGG